MKRIKCQKKRFLEMWSHKNFWVPSSKKKKNLLWDVIEVISLIGSHSLFYHVVSEKTYTCMKNMHFRAVQVSWVGCGLSSLTDQDSEFQSTF